MELYNVPRKSYVRLLEDSNAPVGREPNAEGEVFFFDHIDGMYSYCTDAAGSVVHLAAWQDVEIVESPQEGKNGKLLLDGTRGLQDYHFLGV